MEKKRKRGLKDLFLGFNQCGKTVEKDKGQNT